MMIRQQIISRIMPNRERFLSSSATAAEEGAMLDNITLLI